MIDPANNPYWVFNIYGNQIDGYHSVLYDCLKTYEEALSVSDELVRRKLLDPDSSSLVRVRISEKRGSGSIMLHDTGWLEPYDPTYRPNPYGWYPNFNRSGRGSPRRLFKKGRR